LAKHRGVLLTLARAERPEIQLAAAAELLDELGRTGEEPTTLGAELAISRAEWRSPRGPGGTPKKSLRDERVFARRDLKSLAYGNVIRKATITLTKLDVEDAAGSLDEYEREAIRMHLEDLHRWLDRFEAALQGGIRIVR
jgi:hypothetical protein